MRLGFTLELIFVFTFHSLITCKIIIYFNVRAVLAQNRLLVIRVQNFNTFLFRFFKPPPVDLKDELYNTILFKINLKSLPSPAEVTVSICVIFATYVSDCKSDALFNVVFSNLLGPVFKTFHLTVD